MTKVLYETKLSEDLKDRMANGFSFYWFVFLFTCIFPPMFLPIDVRLIISSFWLMMGNKKIQKNDTSLVISLTVLSMYTLIVYVFNYFLGDNNVSIGIPLRFFRSLLMLVAIISCLSTRRAHIEKNKILNSLELLLVCHSLIIIIEIIIPATRDYLYIFAGNARIFYQYRASGFVNSFDFAGFYCIVGALLSCFLHFISNKKIHIYAFLICIVATIFTSRINMFVCLLLLLFVNFKIRLFSSGDFLKLIIKILIIAIAAIVILMWAITTDIFTNIRTYLFSNYSWMEDFYSTIRYTYSDDDISQKILFQFNIEGDSVFKLFGTAKDPNRDPGYVQMLYGIGIIGTFLSFVPFLVMVVNCKKNRSYNNKDADIMYKESIYIIMMVVVLYQIAMNTKILFLYSTGAFELCIIMYMIFQIYNRGITYDNRGKKNV